MPDFFDAESVAELYGRGRPYHQDAVIGKVGAFFHLSGKVGWALDVACGTGLSCVALKEIAERIVGTDISQEMIRHTTLDARIGYLVCPAEALAVSDESMDAVTVSSAFHWFDRDLFLVEAYRVLKREGWLIIYNNGFSANMKENPAYSAWNADVHVERFPTPPRDNRPLEEADAFQAGFRLVGRDRYTNDVQWDKEGLINYLITQTNVIAAIQSGEWKLEEVTQILSSDLDPIYSQIEKGTFGFRGPIWYYNKVELAGT